MLFRKKIVNSEEYLDLVRKHNLLRAEIDGLAHQIDLLKMQFSDLKSAKIRRLKPQDEEKKDININDGFDWLRKNGINK